jgi:hypothetical protein
MSEQQEQDHSGKTGNGQRQEPEPSRDATPLPALVGCCNACGTPPAIRALTAPRTGYLSVDPQCHCASGFNLWHAATDFRTPVSLAALLDEAFAARSECEAARCAYEDMGEGTRDEFQAATQKYRTARTALDRALAEYVADRERLLSALAGIGIQRNVWYPDESEWLTVTEPHGEEPADSLDAALATMLRAAENDGRRESRQGPIRYDQVPDGCWVACIAGLTDIPHDQLAALVPVGPFDDNYKRPEYHNAVNALMRESGWRLAYIGPDVPRGFAIGSGTSPRGHHHAVIVLDGKLWHDPHPSRAGIECIEEYEVIIPLADSPAMHPEPADVSR